MHAIHSERNEIFSRKYMLKLRKIMYSIHTYLIEVFTIYLLVSNLIELYISQNVKYDIKIFESP